MASHLMRSMKLLIKISLITYEDIKNSLDLINDKIKLKQKLSSEEQSISNLVGDLERRYFNIIKEVTKKSIDVDTKTEEEIRTLSHKSVVLK